MAKAKWQRLKSHFVKKMIVASNVGELGSLLSVGRTGLFVAFIVSFSLILSVGPNIQYFTFSLISSDAPTVYASAYQDSLVRFPDLREWLLAGLDWRFLLIAAVVVVFSIRRKTAQAVLASSALATFISLTIHDGLIGIFSHNLSAAYMLENVIADAIGCGLLAFIFVGVLTVAHVCILNLPGSKLLRQLIVATVVLIVGLSTNAAAFYSAAFFYKAVTVRLDVVLARATAKS